MSGKTSAFGLSGNQLKILAMLLMTIDHIGAYLLPQYTALRYIGRLSMPIFAWMIAEGAYHTRSRLRYLVVMLLFGAVTQAVNIIFLDRWTLNIMVTFSLSLLVIYGVDQASKNKNFLTLCWMSAMFGAVVYLCLYADAIAGIPISVEYGLVGVLLPVLIFMGKNKPEKLLLAAVGLTVLGMVYNGSQMYALLSLPLLALYNGKRGKRSMKYLFYLYYPLHLVAIYAIGMLLNR